MKRLQGKIAFVTGGSRGMGAMIAKRFAEEGAHIVFTHSGKNPHKAQEVLDYIQLQGVEGLCIIADNRDPKAILYALERTVDRFGTLDILVNNAGVYAQKAIDDFSLEEYEEVMDVNVKAVFVASQFGAKHISANGRIITIGSNMAERVTFSAGSLYAMSKSALLGLTKGLARDLGDKNITVNLIQPGPVDTDMNPADSAHAPFLVNALAIKRYGRVEEIASVAAFLASDEAGFITGTTITVDGGFNI